jgi:hypothetical protein
MKRWLIPDRFFYLFFVLWGFIFSPLHSQYGIFSPYSRLGMGLPYSESLAPAAFWGAASVAGRGSAFLNPANPASYSALENLMLQFGMEAQHYRQFRGSLGQTGSHAYFSQFALSLPLPPRKMALVTGFTPFTGTRYLYQSLDTLRTPSDTLSVRLIYEGYGGVDKYFLGWGTTVTGGLSAGINGLLYLGNLQHYKITEYVNASGFINTRFRESQRIRGLGLEAGLQYQVRIRKITLTAGLAGEYGFQARTKEHFLTEYYYGSFGDNPLLADTFYIRRNQIRRPSALRAALAFGKPGKWTLGAGWEQVFWSQYRRNGQPESLLGDRAARSLSLEVLPFRSASRSLFAASILTLSVRYDTEALRPSEKPFQSFGMAFGLSLPVLTNSLMDRKLSSWLNLGLAYSLLHHPDPQVTRQNTFRFIFAVNLRDKWTPRFKYN